MSYHLSIIIPMYETKPDVLERCLQSIFKAEKPAELQFEVILVDSSSHFLPPEFLKKFPELHYEYSSSRLYCGDARMLGISRARFDRFFFFDSDCMLDSDWFTQYQNF